MKTNRHFKRRVSSKVSNFKIAGSVQGNKPSWRQQTDLSSTARDSTGQWISVSPLCSATTLHPPVWHYTHLPQPTLATVRHKSEEICTGQHWTWPSVYWLLTTGLGFFFFSIVKRTQNVMYGKILLGVCLSIQCKMPGLLTSIQPDKRRCSYNSLSHICWEYTTVQVELVTCLQTDICKGC